MKINKRSRWSIWSWGIFIMMAAIICGQMTSKTEAAEVIYNNFLTKEKGFKVEGNKIVDLNGKQIIFMGLARPSLEWNPNGEWGADNLLTLDDFKVMADWGANIVRLPLNQKFWLDPDKGDVYKQTVERAVKFATTSGMAVVLDLHWSDKGMANGGSGQQRMADKRSLEFWKQIAKIYKINRQVLFEIYNEPHDISPQVCMYGGDSGDGFQVVGMQELANAIRDEGAENIVIINGCDNWGFNLAGIPRLRGNNVVYGSHPYGQYADKNDLDKFEQAFGFLKNQYPVMITEFGSTTETDCKTGMFDQKVINYAEKNNISWIAWAFGPWGCGFPGLLNSWDPNDRNPSGEVVYRTLKKRQLRENFVFKMPIWWK